MRIRCFTTGVVREKAGERRLRRYVVDRWRSETLPVHAFLVEHPQGLLLFDTGQTSRAVEAGYLPQWHPFLRLSRFELSREDELAAQLAQADVSSDDVRWVVLSHLHNDHVGGVAAFPQADVLVSRTEWERSLGFVGQLRGYVPQHWPPMLVPHVVDFDSPPLGPFAASYEVTGDGLLVAVPTPGHTPGHIALLVRGDRSFLLAGDVAHTRAELEGTAPRIAAWCRANDVVVLLTHDERAPDLAASSR